MSVEYHFAFEPHWWHAPLAFWVHVPVDAATGHFEPPAPSAIAHKGFAVLHVSFDRHELVFSSPEQLDHFIEVLAKKPLPTSRQLSARRGAAMGPNGHWLSRLPAALKTPRVRARLVQALRGVRAQVVGVVRGPRGDEARERLSFTVAATVR